MNCPVHGMTLKDNPQFMQGVRSWSYTQCDYRYEIDQTDKDRVNQRLTMSVPLMPVVDEGKVTYTHKQPSK